MGNGSGKQKVRSSEKTKGDKGQAINTDHPSTQTQRNGHVLPTFDEAVSGDKPSGNKSNNADESAEMLQLRGQVAESKQMLDAMMAQMAQFTAQVIEDKSDNDGYTVASNPGVQTSGQSSTVAHHRNVAAIDHVVLARVDSTEDEHFEDTYEHPLAGSYDSVQLKALAAPPPDPIFERFARTVFRQADVDCDGYLSPPEFEHVLSADVLSVALDADEANDLFRSADTDRAGRLSFVQFCTPFRTLLQHAYHGDEHEDWVHVGFSGTAADALPVYLNWRTGEMTEMAAHKDEVTGEEQDDTFDFELMVREDDGMVLTTYINETGARVFIDGDRWRQVDPAWELTPVDADPWSTTGTPRPGSARPRSAAPSSRRGTSVSAVSAEEPDDGAHRFVYFEIADAATGHVYQCARTTDAVTNKLYYEDSTDSWKVLPAVWEAAQPSTARLLEEMDAVLPQWRNVTEQVLALRIFQYDVSAAIAWKTADVEAGGGHWGAMNVQQTALINSLEEALTKKGAVIDELQKAEEKSDRVLSQAGRDLEQSEQDVKDTTDHLQRSRKRITILEEELTQQFEDLQKQSTRQRGRIAVLESELESTIALSTGTKNRQEQQIAALSQKVTRLEDAETMQQSKHDDKFDELRIEIIGARTEAADAAELRKEVAVLKAKLLDQQAVQITAENKSAEAVALRKQITKAAAEMESTAEEHRTAARTTAKELETTKLALEQLKGSTETTIAQLRAELGEKSSELAASNQEGMVSMSELALMEKEDEMKVLRGNVVNLTEKVESLKHGSAAMVGTIKYTVQDLKASKEVLQRDTRSIISGAVRLWEQLQPAVVRLIAIVNNVEIDKRELVRKYQSEVAARRLLYNKIQELKGNIRCFCRVRFDDRAAVAVSCISDTEILIPTGKDGRTKCFEFDKVYPPAATQSDVYEDAKGIIQSTVDGYNVVYMAYGQTGSGKTFTMMGPPDNAELAGVNRRAITDLFQMCKERTDFTYTFTINMVEVYNDQIFDLLVGHHVEPLKLKQLPDGKTVLDGVTIRSVHKPEDVAAVLAEADVNRSVAATAMNMHSSRSHLILQVTVEGVNLVSEVRTCGKLSLVDLAGSERVARSEAVGVRLLEAAAINKSLSALGQIFAALAARQKHVPYRNSKLTHLLQDSLGGDAKACMFLNCSPLAENLAETKSTMNFGAGIAKIELGPVRKNVAK